MSKTALITGATSGIGKATAELLASNNFNLIITGRRADRLEALAEVLRASNGVKVETLCFDVRNYDEVTAQIQGLDQRGVVLDVLVNNAGLASGLDQIQNGDVEDWNKMIDTNVKGLLYVSRQVIPLMIKRGSGHIVNIGSIAGKEVYPNGNVYCGTKHMVDALNKSMRRELAEHGIKVSAVNPGAVETEFSLVRLHGNTEKAKTVYDGFENLVAEDIADAVYYIISRPEHVNINDLIIMPKAQPAAGTVIRNKGL
ncbi:MAG: 3-hydroxy acid dehydrogenase/malonic semialdehyde reductase [Bacteroidia bacterium]|jgi:3-hydroxy acid dehydrogenase/malonic semialdehyde reductase